MTSFRLPRRCLLGATSVLVSVAVVLTIDAEPLSAGSQQNRLDRHTRVRAGAALLRSRVAVGRAVVAMERIATELARIDRPVETLSVTTMPRQLDFDRPATLEDLALVAASIYDHWQASRALARQARSLMKPYLPSKPHAVGVPEWAEQVADDFPPGDRVTRTPAMLLRYSERGAFLSEQAAQMAEIAEEQAITLADIELYRRQHRKAEGSSARHETPRWRPLGPDTIRAGEGYNGQRVPVSGRVTSLVLDAGNPEIVYAGSALGGVWRSLDRGTTWEALTDQAPSLAVGALAAHPHMPGRVYAGTGEANTALRDFVVRGDRRLAGQRGKGILHTRDGGHTWHLLGANLFDGAAFAQLALSSIDPRRLLAATTRGLFRSLDEGETWTRMRHGLPQTGPGRAATSVVIMASNLNGALVAFWGSGIYRTTELGHKHPRWHRVTEGLPLSNMSRVHIAAAPSNPNRLYALYATADSKLRGLYTSSDAGTTWTAIPNAPDLLQGQGFYNMLLTVSPTDEHLFYLGGAGDRSKHPSSLYRATHRGSRWAFQPVGGEMHIDFHDMVFDPNDSRRAYVANDGGIWRTDDDGATWTACNHGLAITQIIQIDQHPTSPDFMVAGSQDNGTLVYHGERAWEHGDDGDGGTVAIDPHSPNIVYSEFIAHRLARSTESARYGSFIPIYPPVDRTSAFLAPFDLNPANSSEIALGADRVYITANAGASWSRIDYPFAMPSGKKKKSVVSALLFAGENRLYLGTSVGRVWRLDREGHRWAIQEISAALNHAIADAYVTALASPPGEPDTLYIALDPGSTVAALWRYSANGNDADTLLPVTGTDPERSLPSRPIYTVAVDPRDRSTLYAGSETAVYTSCDSGQSWQVLGAGLPRTAVFAVQPHASLPLVRVGTFGRGVWEIDTTALARRQCSFAERSLHS